MVLARARQPTAPMIARRALEVCFGKRAREHSETLPVHCGRDLANHLGTHYLGAAHMRPPHRPERVPCVHSPSHQTSQLHVGAFPFLWAILQTRSLLCYPLPRPLDSACPFAVTSGYDKANGGRVHLFLLYHDRPLARGLTRGEAPKVRAPTRMPRVGA
jgi:hypothetical protein